MREKAIQWFREKIGEEPDAVVRSPGRVNLIGEHTDYNDGFVMPLAVDRATWIAFRRRSAAGCRVFSVDFQEWGEAYGQPGARGDASWKAYLAGVAVEFRAAHPAMGGWEGVSLSDLPIGAGLSSSASFELGLARVFAAVSGVEWNATEMALLGHRAEVKGVGVNCGTMDQLAVALGRQGYALQIDCRSLEVKALPLPRGSAVVIMDTSKARTLAGSAYNERRRQCEEAAAIFGAGSLRDVSLDTFRQKEKNLPAVLAARARHVISENGRVLRAGQAMEKGEAEELGRLMNESHESLRADYEVSCRELDLIVAAAREQEGCLGARMTGAGFGGCAVALVREEAVERFMPEVAARYEAEAGLSAKLYLTGAAAGTELVR
jgi:galactokinase